MQKGCIGFSTGALAKGNYREALQWMKEHLVQCVELSALRYQELEPLVDDLDAIELSSFRYVSFHAPSAFEHTQEGHVLTLLERVFRKGWNIVVHPDVIYTPSRWQHFGDKLLIENMDRRKSTGRSAREIQDLLKILPSARLCLDLAHARQLDTTLSLLWTLTEAFKERIAEVHISELDSRCRHHLLSWQAVVDYRHFSSALSEVPVIIESILYKYDNSLREQEIKLAKDAMMR